MWALAVQYMYIMQFLPAFSIGTTDEMNQLHIDTTLAPMDNKRDVYSWPTGWKDLHKRSPLPLVVDESKDSFKLKEDDHFGADLPKLPSYKSSDIPSLDGDVQQRRQTLKRQGKIYVGIGSLFPPLQEAVLSLSLDEASEGAGATKYTEVELHRQPSFHNELANGSQDCNDKTSSKIDILILDNVNNTDDGLKGQEKNHEVGYAIYHNGTYFEVRDTHETKPALDKHELRLNPGNERQMQEEYISEQLRNSPSFTRDHGGLLGVHTKEYNHPSNSLDYTTSRKKTVTFTPDLSVDIEDKGSGGKLSPLSHRGCSRGNNMLSPDHKERTRSRTSTSGRSSRKESQRMTPETPPHFNVTQRDNSSERKGSPWKKRFQERLEHINRRIAQNTRGKPKTSALPLRGARSPKIVIDKTTHETVKRTVGEHVHSQSSIKNGEFREEKDSWSTHSNQTDVPSDQTIAEYNHLNLRGTSVHVRKDRRDGSNAFRRQGNPEVVLTSSGFGIPERGHRLSSKVAATATRRKDYVFQFSKTETPVSTGHRVPRSGGIEEWSVEYLGMDAHKYSQDRNMWRQSSGVPTRASTRTSTRASTSGTTTQNYSRTSKGRSNLGKGGLLSAGQSDTEMPIFVRVNSTEGHDRNEIATLPIIGRVDEQDSARRSPIIDRNRLYVGSTVQTNKRKLARKGERTRRRFSKNKLISNRSSDKGHKKVHSSRTDEDNEVEHIMGRRLETSFETPVLMVETDVDSIVSSSGVVSRTIEVSDTPSNTSYLSAKYLNSARSSTVSWGDNSGEDVEEEEEDNLGDLIQVSQVNFSEKDKLRKQSRPVLAKEPRKFQRSPRPRHAKPNAQAPLPPIGSKFSETVTRYGESISRLGEIDDRGDEESKSRQEIRTGRMRPWMKPAGQTFNLPRLQADAAIGMTSLQAVQAREDISRVVSEIEKMRWNQEQHDERVHTYGHDNFMNPRIVLVSSRLPRCHSMKKAIKKDKNVIFIVYEFETWSFEDILNAVQSRLDHYHMGCKMHSCLLLCGGGTGFCYLLKNYVMTPQKLQRADYAPVIEFWSKLGHMISKLRPEEAAINVMGCFLEGDKQGREVLAVIRKAVHPNIVRVDSPSEHMAEGRRALNQYFVYRRFLLWRSSNDEVVIKLGQLCQGDLDRQRTWSELAEDADSDS
ncbi:uncharacterized protein [Haliotis cracherodii]|uniref:uncharacterized protein n=1 Tax=Haliotis cracherodii TaxID=6455 RepID=UPI0039E995E0